MTLSQAVARVNELKPNGYGQAVVVGWLSDLDGRILREVYAWHEAEVPEAGPPYDPDGMDRALLVGAPYEDLYIKYLEAQIDYYNAEYTRYNNSMAMFSAVYEAFVSDFNRRHRPKQGQYIKAF